MSGIAGVTVHDGRDLAPELLARLAAAAAPRGFDGVTEWRGGPAGLVRFHHATTPEAVGEVQPFVSPRSGAVIAFDGRLDNRADLLTLIGPDGGPGDRPDCQIALALFEVFGDSFVERLVGDWAIAIWQPSPRRLYCARSPMGWRPLLWTFDGDRFAFATEPRALVVGLDLERRLNEGAIGEFLATRFVTDTETFLDGINRLGQGSALAVEGGRVRMWHWHTGPFEDLSSLSDAGHVDRFRALFDQALIAHMRSSTPVTSHLSGGLDSSSVVCRATELYRAGRIDRQVGAITARFPGESYDETEWSQAVERHLDITATVTAAEPYDLDVARAWCADTLQLPVRPNVFDTTTAAFKMLRADGQRVLLTGEGGDDWMAGTYAHFPDLLRSGRLGELAREGMTQFPDLSIPRRLLRVARLSARPLVSRRGRAEFLRPHLKYGPTLPAWIQPAWAARVGLVTRWQDHAFPVDPPGFAQKQRYSTFAMARRHVAHDPILALAERHGIEMRHPMHDLRLATFFMGASGRMLRRHGERKYILREAMRGTLPEVVRTRQSKAMFVTGIIDALIGRFRERSPAQLLPVQLGWLDGRELERMFAPARAWRESGSTADPPREALSPVWCAVAMDLWLEHGVRL